MKNWINSTFGERMRWARKRKHLTQGEVAKAIGLKSRNAVTLWEGDNNKAEGRNLANAARILGVDQRWLDTGIGNPDPSSNPVLGVNELAAGYSYDIRELIPTEPDLLADVATLLALIKTGKVTKKHLSSFIDMFTEDDS